MIPSKVSVIWRMLFMVVIGALLGSFMTIGIITKRLETGDTINIGKIKIKNAHNIELPITLEHSETDSTSEKKLTRKEKRQQRKDK